VRTVVGVSVGFVIAVFGLAALSKFESSSYPWVALAGAVAVASITTLVLGRRYVSKSRELRLGGTSAAVMLILSWIVLFCISWFFLYSISKIGVV